MKATHRALILEELQRGPVTNTALNNICFRYSARIHELRKALQPEGVDIVTRRLGGGLFSYSLTKCAVEPLTPKQQRERALIQSIERAVNASK